MTDTMRLPPFTPPPSEPQLRAPEEVQVPTDIADAPDEERPLTVGALLAHVTPRVWVTPALMVLIVAGFVVELALGVNAFEPTAADLWKVGGSFGESFVDGQVWRSLSSMFLHAGVLHLAFNLWAFFSVGVLTERIFGNRAFLAIYVIGGLGASLTSLAWNPLVVGVGASGAIFAVYGALLAFVLLHRGVLPASFLKQQQRSLLGFLGYNVLFGMSQHNIDMAAHAGGLVVGMASGALLSRDLLAPKAHVGRRVLGVLGLCAALVAAGFLVRQRVANVPSIRASRTATAAIAELRAERYPEAIDLFTRAIADDATAASYFNRSLAHSATQNWDLAAADVELAFAKDPKLRKPSLLCELGARANKPESLERTESLCTEAIAADPTDANSLGFRASVRKSLKRPDDALADATLGLTLDPKDVFLRAMRVEIHYERKEYDVAESDCEVLLASPDARPFDLDICTHVAMMRADASAPDRADRWVAADPSASALLLRAAIHERAGRVAESRADLDRVVALEPTLAAGWNNRAWMEVVAGDFAAALTDADKALAIEPEVADFLGTRCFARVGVGDLSGARADCAKALEMRAGERNNRIDLGMLAFIDKRYADARKQWQSVEDATMARELKPWLAKLPK